MMAGAAIATSYLELGAGYSMLVTTAMGAAPAALASVLALELSQPRLRVVPTACRAVRASR